MTDDNDYSGHSYYEFNAFGNLNEYRSLDKKGKTNWVNVYTYNKDNVRRELTTIEDDKVDHKEISKIDGKNIVEIKSYDNDGNITNTYRYDYSGADISSGTILNDKGKVTITFENEYSNGKLRKQIVNDSLGNFNCEQNYKRNGYDDVISYTYSKSKDTIKDKYKYKYDYDEKNNWIRRYDFDKEGKIANIIVRNIIYYDHELKERKSDDFVGMWFIIDDNDWIEFRRDKKYDFGYSSRIKESGSWEMDNEQRILTFRADDPDDSKKYKYAFEGYQLVLYAIDGKEKLRLEKR